MKPKIWVNPIFFVAVVIAIVMAMLCGCSHECPRCPKTIYIDKPVTRTIVKEIPVYIIVNDDARLQAAYQIAREALIGLAHGNDTRWKVTISCSDGAKRYYPDYAQWKLKQIDCVLRSP